MAKELTKKQESFLKKKTLGHRFMPFILMLFSVCCFGSFIFLFFTQPLLVNPKYVSNQLAQGLIKPEVSNLMLVLFPVIIFMTYITMVGTLLITLSYFRAEKKFLTIIQTLREN